MGTLFAHIVKTLKKHPNSTTVSLSRVSLSNTFKQQSFNLQLQYLLDFNIFKIFKMQFSYALIAAAACAVANAVIITNGPAPLLPVSLEPPTPGLSRPLSPSLSMLSRSMIPPHPPPPARTPQSPPPALHPPELEAPPPVELPQEPLLPPAPLDPALPAHHPTPTLAPASHPHWHSSSWPSQP